MKNQRRGEDSSHWAASSGACLSCYPPLLRTLSPPLFPRSAVSDVTRPPQRSHVSHSDSAGSSPGSRPRVLSTLPTQWSARHSQAEQARRWRGGGGDEKGRSGSIGEAWIMGPNFNEKTRSKHMTARLQMWVKPRAIWSKWWRCVFSLSHGTPLKCLFPSVKVETMNGQNISKDDACCGTHCVQS